MTQPANTFFSVRDFQTGSDIIARIPLANPQQANADIHRLLDSLLATPPDNESYFRLLEQLRLPVAFSNDELAKRYQNKPLPLGDVEETFFQSVVSLWQKMARAYTHCAGESVPEEDEATHALRIATVLHRCIHYIGQAIMAHQRARRELCWGLWHDLHGFYASAEEWGVASLAVSDALDPLHRSTHCAAAYVSIILCEMASCYSLSVRDQLLVYRWAQLWAPLVSLHPARPGESLPAFVIDLMQDTALRPVADCLQTEYLRRLDISHLAAHLRQIRQQLRQKTPPAQLALGEDCTSGQCARLLDILFAPWSHARPARKFRRHAMSGTVRLCTGFEEMHYFVSGEVFEQPENVRTYSRKEFDSLFAFRHQVDPQQTLNVRREQLAYGVDTWEVVNQSANGFRLMRSTSGRKMVHGQLIALCPHDGARFFLATTTWLMQEENGGLIAGVRSLPGIPLAIAARTIEQAGEPAGKYHRSFLLPAVPAVSAEPSLVLPQGWFRSGRVVELFGEGAWRVKLLQTLEEGPDFERVSFIAC